MAKKLYTEAYISDIADAVREKNGTQTQYKVSQMGDAVRAIVNAAGGSANAVFVEFTPDSGHRSFTINVPNASNYTNFAFILTGTPTGGTESAAVIKVGGAVYSMRYSNGTLQLHTDGEITINENSVYIYSYYSANFIIGQKHALIGW